MTTMKAYSILDIKDLHDGEERIIKGMATTPTPDRVDDIVEPLGVKSLADIPLFLYHDATKTVGRVQLGKATAKGVPFEARIAKVAEPGALKDRVDEAWQLVKYKLVTGVSIGFRAVQDKVEVLKTGGLRFLETEVFELSLVPVPANAEATIATVKSIDQKHLPPPEGQEAALLSPGIATPSEARNKFTSPGGESKPLAALLGGIKALPAGRKTMNIQDQIKQFEATRQAKDAARTKMMEDAGEKGETLDADNATQYDELTEQIGEIDKHLKRLDIQEKSELSRARPVAGTTSTEATTSRGAEPIVIGLAKKLPPGIAFARYAIAKAIAARDHLPAAEVFKQRYPDMEQIHQVLKAEQMFGGMQNMLAVSKAAVPAATTTDTTWAKPLVAYNDFAGDFQEFMRPFSVIGKFGTNGVPALRSAPFNVHIKGQTSGGTGYWVGEGQAKPVTKFDFNDVYLAWYKLAAITVATDELLRFSNPGAEALLRDALKDAIVAKMDTSFIDPTFAAVAGVNPASITNGVTAITPSGTTAAALRADIARLWAAWQAVNLDATTPVYIMDSATAIRLSAMRTTLESTRQFPDLTYQGGALDGVPVIVSNYVTHATAGGTIILVNASDIYLSDDGEVTIDSSREASLQMDNAPTNASGPTVAATTVVSMFQTNSMAIRAERYINWAKRRSTAVQLISATLYA